MELVLVVVELILWIVDLLAMAVDVYAWFKGKENRVERRDARSVGGSMPPRDKWNRRVITLTLTVVVVTGALLLWRAS